MKTWILYLAALLIGSIHTQSLIGQSYESEVKPQGIVFPRLTTSQQNSLSAIKGQCIYNIDTNELNCYNGLDWVTATTNTSTQNITLSGQLSDSDFDTKIQVEEFADEDKIRFDIEGTEVLSLEKNMNDVFRINYKGQYDNLIIGDQAGANITPFNVSGQLESRYNTIIGSFAAGNSTTVGKSNTLIGHASGSSLNGIGNTFVGASAGSANVVSNTGNNNTFIGRFAGGFTQSGGGNTFIGTSSGIGNATGNVNVNIGDNSGASSVASFGSVSIGGSAASNVSNGNFSSVIIGYEAGQNGQTLARNVIIGAQAGKAFPTTNFIEGNVVLGNEAGYSLNGSNNVFIGNQAGYSEQGNNKLYIEGSNSLNPLIYGEFDNDLVKVNGTLHISETAKLTPLTTVPMCTSAEEGLIYFKASDRTLQICKGALGWKEVLTN